MDDPRTRFVASRNTALTRLMQLGAAVNQLQERHEANPTNAAVLAEIDRVAEALRKILDDLPGPPPAGARP
jgi:uncharacterized protein involved in exopolysaccharide biosynthesis